MHLRARRHASTSAPRRHWHYHRRPRRRRQNPSRARGTCDVSDTVPDDDAPTRQRSASLLYKYSRVRRLGARVRVRAGYRWALVAVAEAASETRCDQRIWITYKLSRKGVQLQFEEYVRAVVERGSSKIHTDGTLAFNANRMENWHIMTCYHSVKHQKIRERRAGVA